MISVIASRRARGRRRFLFFGPERTRPGVYFAKRAFTKTRILVFFWWKMCGFGESYKNKEPRRTTCGTGECGAWLPDPPLTAPEQTTTHIYKRIEDRSRSHTYTHTQVRVSSPCSAIAVAMYSRRDVPVANLKLGIVPDALRFMTGSSTTSAPFLRVLTSTQTKSAGVA